MPTADRPDPMLVTAARNGDRAALDALLAQSMPLVYTIVGRALGGHADVDDVVQDIMMRAVHGLPGLRDPGSYRSWLVAIVVRQLRNHHRSRRSDVTDIGSPEDVADPRSDFVEITIARLGLSGQRREVVLATEWLDPDDRELLSLWWLEVAGQLSRTEVAEAMRLSSPHAGVRVQRMKEQLNVARAVVRALQVTPRCADLAALTSGWNGATVPLWRKRLARHVLSCPRCGQVNADQVPLNQLLASVPLTPPPDALIHAVYGASHGAAAGHGAFEIGHAAFDLGGQNAPTFAGQTTGFAGPGATAAGEGGRHVAATGFKGLLQTHAAVVKPILVGLTALAVIAGGAAFFWRGDDPAAVAADVPAVAATATPTTTPSLEPTTLPPSPSVTPSARPSTTTAKPPAPPAAGVKSPKKGVSAWAFPGFTAAIADVKASWYYNWASTRQTLTPPAGVEFVPMIWGKDSVKPSTLNEAKAAGGVLLGFNEPDLAEQANMTVTQALDLWPQLEATGMRLGSPAPAWGADKAGGWFDQFMAGATQRGYRVDFIALHWYGSDFSAAATNQLKGYLQAVYNRYHKPIWLTEYALMNFGGGAKYPSQQQQAAFATASVAMLESLSFVERYAWFALPATEGSGTGLYSDGTTPTTVGAAYRAAG